MPGRLYFYVNLGTIELSEKFSKSRKLGRPLLRDIEWKVFRYWEETRGFSGFQFDKHDSCNRLLDFFMDIESGEMRRHTDEEISLYLKDDNGNTIKAKYDNIYKEDGTRKRFVPARDYLARQYPAPMGKPLHFNEALNMLMMGPRGWGKSYIGGNLAAHEFIFCGMDDYDEYLSILADPSKKHPRTNVIVGAGDAKYSSATLSKTWMSLEHMPGGQELGDKYYPSPFATQTKGSLPLSIKRK